MQSTSSSVLILVFTALLLLPNCKSANQSSAGSTTTTQNNQLRTKEEVEIIVKLIQGTNVDSLTNAYSRYHLKPVKCLAPNHNMWLLSALAGNAYALVEILRKDKQVENAEINKAINPRK